MRPHQLILTCMIVMIALANCSMEGVQHISVVDDNKQNVNDIVVLPLYFSSGGIGIGPEGKGLSVPGRAFTKPFRFNSGEDLMSKQIQGRGIIIPVPPYIFIGTSKYVGHYLFIKKGFTPKVVTREMVYGESPIVMSFSKNEDGKKCIDALLSKKYDQAVLKKIFNSSDLEEDIKVELDKHDITLLEANR